MSYFVLWSQNNLNFPKKRVSFDAKNIEVFQLSRIQCVRNGLLITPG